MIYDALLYKTINIYSYMHLQEIKNSPHTLNSQGDLSPPKLHALTSVSSNSTTFKRIFSNQIFALGPGTDSNEFKACMQNLLQGSERSNSQFCDNDIHRQFQNNRQTNQKRFSYPIKKAELFQSCKQDKSQTVDNSHLKNDLSLNCVLIHEDKMAETVCNMRMGIIQFEKIELSLQVSKMTKMKIKYEGYQKCLEITYNDTKNNRLSQCKIKIHILNDIKDDLYILFSKIIIKKLHLLSFKVNQHEKDDDKVDRFVMVGSILKRSKFIGKWSMRKMIITDHIESFKCEKRTVQINNVKEVWTRFDILDNNLVIKIRHALDKTELAVPITNYCARFCKDNWMYRIYKLVSPSLT